MDRDIERILFTHEAIQAGVREVAGRIRADFSGGELTVVPVLEGSFVFAADLVRSLDLRLKLAFVKVQSYRSGVVPGELVMQFAPERREIEGRGVLLVDDILDTGRTLQHLRGEFEAMGAARVSTCVLLDKPSRRRVPIQADYRVFEVPEGFVVGYGLDRAGAYRNLPYVGVLKPELHAAVTEQAGCSESARASAQD